jgi:hypothetical protein
MKGSMREYEFAGSLRVQDVDREIALSLLSLAHDFDRWEIGQVVAYVIRVDAMEVGRLVIAPGTGARPGVRIREHHTLLKQQQSNSSKADERSSLSGGFASLCGQIRQTVESLECAGGSEEFGETWHPETNSSSTTMSHRTTGMIRDSCHFAYPRSKRMKIVQHYRSARADGEVHNKDQWARRNYQISGRTLFNYESEFPQTDEHGSGSVDTGPAALE